MIDENFVELSNHRTKTYEKIRIILKLDRGRIKNQQILIKFFVTLQLKLKLPSVNQS